MDCNKDEACRAKEMAEKRFAEKDLAGAKKYAIKAHNLYPGLDGITQMLATFDVYLASQVKINGETDFYSILGLNPLADDDTVKKQYRKMALVLHPDKNKTVGAEGAFKYVSEAWSILSDTSKRSSYDQRRNLSSAKPPRQKPPKRTANVNGSHNPSKSSNSNSASKRYTFWTTCCSCKVQFEKSAC
ncbi:hypothetical protein H6P81_014852 [Aristolochia fimbriata]|uniref:J domain-containing protein n=1 Tax=Aristolochia fimbriata TaxID=158543 RepID=A0AAV7E3U2_ARIFI|nr:hypothetical protein H6P81_014852 [Aristolochia fimbriata]